MSAPMPDPLSPEQIASATQIAQDVLGSETAWLIRAELQRLARAYLALTQQLAADNVILRSELAAERERRVSAERCAQESYDTEPLSHLNYNSWARHRARWPEGSGR